MVSNSISLLEPLQTGQMGSDIEQYSDITIGVPVHCNGLPGKIFMDKQTDDFIFLPRDNQNYLSEFTALDAPHPQLIGPLTRSNTSERVGTNNIKGNISCFDSVTRTLCCGSQSKPVEGSEVQIIKSDCVVGIFALPASSTTSFKSSSQNSTAAPSSHSTYVATAVESESYQPSELAGQALVLQVLYGVPYTVPACGVTHSKYRLERSSVFHVDPTASAAALGLVTALRRRCCWWGRSDPPRIVAVVNPFSGQGHSLQILNNTLLPALRGAAGMVVVVHSTQYPGHAKRIVEELAVYDVDLLVFVGGDGTVYEGIQGLLGREDWREAVERVSFAACPSGSGNGLAASTGLWDVDTAAVSICRGGKGSIDMASMVQEEARESQVEKSPKGTERYDKDNGINISGTNGGNSNSDDDYNSPMSNMENGNPSCTTTSRRTTRVPKEKENTSRRFSFLSLVYGVMANLDIGTENLRWMGEARFTVGGVYELLANRGYAARLAYLPPPSTAGRGGAGSIPSCGSTPGSGSNPPKSGSTHDPLGTSSSTRKTTTAKTGPPLPLTGSILGGLSKGVDTGADGGGGGGRNDSGSSDGNGQGNENMGSKEGRRDVEDGGDVTRGKRCVELEKEKNDPEKEGDDPEIEGDDPEWMAVTEDGSMPLAEYLRIHHPQVDWGSQVPDGDGGGGGGALGNITPLANATATSSTSLPPSTRVPFPPIATLSLSSSSSSPSSSCTTPLRFTKRHPPPAAALACLPQVPLSLFALYNTEYLALSARLNPLAGLQKGSWDLFWAVHDPHPLAGRAKGLALLNSVDDGTTAQVKHVHHREVAALMMDPCVAPPVKKGTSVMAAGGATWTVLDGEMVPSRPLVFEVHPRLCKVIVAPHAPASAFKR